MSYCVESCASKQISVVPNTGYTRGGQLYEALEQQLHELTLTSAMHLTF